MTKHLKGVSKIVKHDFTKRLVRLGYLIRGMLYIVVGIITMEVGVGWVKEAIGTKDVLQIVSKIQTLYG